MTKKTVIILSMVIFLAGFFSQGYALSTSIGIKTGTLGGGLEVDTAFTKSIGARVGVNYFQYDYSGKEDDIEYEFDLNLESASALLYWCPFRGSFRISGGVLYNNNDLEAKSKASSTFSIGDTTYFLADVGTIEGSIDFNEVSPYLSVGWDKSFGRKKRLGFLIELGAIYQDTPNIDLSATGPIAGDAMFQDDLAEEESNLEDDLDFFKFYPVIGSRISYRF